MKIIEKVKTYLHFSDSAPQHELISPVAIYPIDDTGKPSRTVPAVSRVVVDNYVEQHDSETRLDAILRGIARRLTAPTGGETIQNISMLYDIDPYLNRVTEEEEFELFGQTV